jgi:hypothetical protein
MRIGRSQWSQPQLTSIASQFIALNLTSNNYSPIKKYMNRLADGQITYARAEAAGLNTTNTPSKVWSANPIPDLDYGLRFAG